MHGDESNERARDARHDCNLKAGKVEVKCVFTSNCATKPSFKKYSKGAFEHIGQTVTDGITER